MKKMEWAGGKVVRSYSLSRRHDEFVQKLAREFAKERGLRQQSTSAVVRTLIDNEARKRGLLKEAKPKAAKVA